MPEHSQKPAAIDAAPITAAEAGRRGGNTTKQRHGTTHYQRIGQLGGAKLRELVERGKAAEVIP